MKLKINDSVIVQSTNVAVSGEPTINLPAVILATHVYPDGTEIVSVKGEDINGWFPIQNDIFHVVKA